MLRFGAQATLALGLAITAIGMALMSFVTAEGGHGLPMVALTVIGLGDAFALFTAFNAILDVLPTEQVAAGTALTRTLQQVGSSFGIAILGSVLNSAYRSELSSHPIGLPASVIDVVRGSVAGAVEISSHLPLRSEQPL